MILHLTRLPAPTTIQTRLAHIGSDSEPVTQEYLDSLLEKARNNALSVSEEPTNSVDILEGDVVQLDIEPKYVCLFLHCVKF